MTFLVTPTHDGSSTLLHPDLDEHYHSTHGAISEALHVFIQHGLLEFISLAPHLDRPLCLFEMGFGSGLNAWLTRLIAAHYNLSIRYICVDTTPLDIALVKKLDYPATFSRRLLSSPQVLAQFPFLTDLSSKISETTFHDLHDAPWDERIPLDASFSITKYHYSLDNFLSMNSGSSCFDLVYFDAFSPRKQPELWSPEVFCSLASFMAAPSILVSYCAQSAFKRALSSCGFSVSALPGPPGKREMTRAVLKNYAAFS
ncbi:MAG: tRNA (5-methylaminomethyl-2-thiouridine)(34)-methyltransferase MnmD [bacterium]